MTTKIADAKAVDRRYDFILLFDVKDGNPNGDPDAGNMPRLDPESMHGLVTDGCLKRKVRDWVQMVKRVSDGNEPGYEIYVQHHSRGGLALNAQHEKAYKALNINPIVEDDAEESSFTGGAGSNKKKSAKGKPARESILATRKWMCGNFFDIRAFGAVMSTGINCGQVRGPVQMTFARSMSPIVPMEVSITRVAYTTVEKAETTKGMSEMGRKNFVPYGLYLSHGFVSPALARDTGFGYADLDLLWQALVGMFEHDRSAARGLMVTRALYVFQHESALGSAPAHKLFERVEQAIKPKKPDVSPRGYTDYDVPSPEVVRRGLPAGVLLRELVDEGFVPSPWGK